MQSIHNCHWANPNLTTTAITYICSEISPQLFPDLPQLFQISQSQIKMWEPPPKEPAPGNPSQDFRMSHPQFSSCEVCAGSCARGSVPGAHCKVWATWQAHPDLSQVLPSCVTTFFKHKPAQPAQSSVSVPHIEPITLHLTMPCYTSWENSNLTTAALNHSMIKHPRA